SMDQFAQFGELRSLNLSHNKVLPWANGSVFQRNSQLSQLDISDNRLYQLTTSMMDDLFLMQNLSFGLNPIECDCSQELFHSEWLRQTVDKPIAYMDTQSPLQSTERYYCVIARNQTRVN